MKPDSSFVGEHFVCSGSHSALGVTGAQRHTHFVGTRGTRLPYNSWLNHNENRSSRRQQRLLPDTEAAEDLVEDRLTDAFTGNFADVQQCVAYVDGDQVEGSAICQRGECRPHALKRSS